MEPDRIAAALLGLWWWTRKGEATTRHHCLTPCVPAGRSDAADDARDEGVDVGVAQAHEAVRAGVAGIVAPTGDADLDRLAAGWVRKDRPAAVALTRRAARHAGT